jgi:hypothetical protein
MAEIAFAAPVVDPMVAFYSLDNSAVSVQASTDVGARRRMSRYWPIGPT